MQAAARCVKFFRRSYTVKKGLHRSFFLLMQQGVGHAFFGVKM